MVKDRFGDRQMGAENNRGDSLYMTESDAISILEAQLMSGAGFLSALATTGMLDRVGLSQVEQALDELVRTYMGQEGISKAVARSLVDVTSILHICAQRYRELSDELWDAADRIDLLIARLFATKPMGESEAAAIVFAQLSGVASIANKLHYHAPIITDSWAEELGEAIDILSEAWKTRDRVPKAIVRPMLAVGDLIIGHAAAYPDKEEQLVSVAGDLVDRVKKCLS